MSSHVENILQCFNMKNAKLVSTSLPAHFKLSFKQCPRTKAEKTSMSRVSYSTAIESLIFTLVGTKLDISQAVGVVSQFMVNPSKEKWTTVKWIFRYLRVTSNVSICYRSIDLQITSFVDSGICGHKYEQKSTIEYSFTLVGGVISWAYKLKSMVTLSTTEAKYVTTIEESKEAIWLEQLLGEFKIIQGKVTLHCDSQSAIHLVKNPSFHDRSKHIDIKYHFIIKTVEEGRILLEKIDTNVSPCLQIQSRKRS